MRRRGFHALLLLAISTTAAPRVPGADLQGVPTPLTRAELHKVDSLLRAVGHDQALDPTVAQILGLTSPGETLFVRQVSGVDDSDTYHKHVHFFNRSENDPNVIILIGRELGTPPRLSN